MSINGVALITGAGKGIGRAIALRLAKDGYSIALNGSRRSEGLDQVRDEIEKMGRKTIECIADVSKEDQVKAMVDATVNDLGGLDVVRDFVSLRSYR
jgi:NAD(P)-dependent dehydrogenase (short-subunit alcohol dehydrogenase family)